MSDGESAQPVRKSRRWILITLLAVLVAGGGGVVAAAAYFYKENVTEIDRRYPREVVKEYVEATLNIRDDNRALLYSCGANSSLQPLKDLRADLERQERDYGVTTNVAITDAITDGASVVAELQVRQTAAGVTTKDIQRWRFTMTQDDGWRVCGTQRLPDPANSPSPAPSASPAT